MIVDDLGDLELRKIVEHEKEALLFNPKDTNQLKEASARYSCCIRTQNLAKLGANAKEKAKLYDSDWVYGRILKVYEELVPFKAK